VLGAGSWAWIPRLAAVIGEFIAVANPVTLTVGALAVGFGTLYAAVKHPVAFGQFIANVQNWFQYKFWPGIVNTFTSGMATVTTYLMGDGAKGVTGAFSGMIGTIINLATNVAMTIGRVMSDLGHLNFGAALADLNAGYATDAQLKAQFQAQARAVT
jgi:hypothetical protein